jgi:hypothetical protein
LYASAIVLSDADKSIAIIDLDHIGFESDFMRHVIDGISRLTGIPSDFVRLSYNHTHSGPNTFRMEVISEGRDMAQSYMEQLPLRIAGAVWQAQRTSVSARCGTSEGSCDIGVNRRLKLQDGRVVIGRNWDGPIDHTVRTIRFDDLQEKPIGTIVHYACHPTIMAWQNQFFTPDYPGVVRKVVEEQVGGLCLFLQGASGNIGPRRGFTGDLRVYRRLGTLLGLEAAKLAIGIETLPRREKMTGLIESGTTIALYEDEPIEPEYPVLDVRFRQIKLPLKPQPDYEGLEAKAVAFRLELEQTRKSGSESAIQKATAAAVQAEHAAGHARLYAGKTHVEWPMQAIRIGSTVLLSIAGEPFIEIGQKIVEGSPFLHTCFSGYSNGGFGYIPVREAFAEGGYEVCTSIFAEDVADIVVREGLEMLRSIADPPD